MTNTLLLAGLTTVLGSSSMAAGVYIGYNHRPECFLESLFSTVSDAMESVGALVGDITETVGSLATPIPEQECQELRDLAREYNLDVVERGEATITRDDDDALVAEWNGEELTRYKEMQGGTNE